MPRNWPLELETLALSYDASGEEQARPQAAPISVASVWQMDSPQAADAALSGATAQFVYRRDGHPNERRLAEKLAKLHGGSRAIITAQGMSSIAAVALSVLRPGRTVWIANELYGKSFKLFADLNKWGGVVRIFDPTQDADIQLLQSAAADLVLVETISNPSMAVPDLQQIIKAGQQAGALVMVDNTFATHLLCRPIELGADIVVESLSKIVCGHSDSMLGLVVTKSVEVGATIRDTMSTFGMASSPLDCYLTERGLMTLALRMERACENAMELARMLAESPSVTRVDYPGLEIHPQHTIAQRQFGSFAGWMLSFQLNSQCLDAQQFIARSRPEIAFVPSLGDVCTTLSHPTSTSHRSLTAPQLAALGITAATVRISCGIEPTTWLLERFRQSLSV